MSLYSAGTTPTELVLYPGESHHFLGEGAPRVRADAARRIIDWIVRYADPSAASQVEGSADGSREKVDAAD